MHLERTHEKEAGSAETQIFGVARICRVRTRRAAPPHLVPTPSRPARPEAQCAGLRGRRLLHLAARTVGSGGGDRAGSSGGKPASERPETSRLQGQGQAGEERDLDCLDSGAELFSGCGPGAGIPEREYLEAAVTGLRFVYFIWRP